MSNSGAPKRRGARGNLLTYPYTPLTTGLFKNYTDECRGKCNGRTKQTTMH